MAAGDPFLPHWLGLNVLRAADRAGGAHHAPATFEQCLCHAQADSARSAGDDGDRLLGCIHRMSFCLNFCCLRKKASAVNVHAVCAGDGRLSTVSPSQVILNTDDLSSFGLLGPDDREIDLGLLDSNWLEDFADF
jgi:hypothetical protein